MKNVETQLVHLIKDGMDLDALILPAHQTRIIMGPNVYAHQKINAKHGKSLTELNAFTLKGNALQIQNGMELTVLVQETVLLDFMEWGGIVFRSLKNASLQLIGLIIDVKPLVAIVLKILILEMATVCLLSPAKMVKNGIRN